MNNVLTPKDCASLAYGAADLAENVAKLDSYKKLVNPDRCPGHTVKVYVTAVIEGAGPIESTLSFPVGSPSENSYSLVPQDNSSIYEEEGFAN